MEKLIFAFAGLAFIIGIMCWVVAIAMDITAPGSSSINSGLLIERQNLLIAGGFLMTIGILVDSAYILQKQLKKIVEALKPNEPGL